MMMNNLDLSYINSHDYLILGPSNCPLSINKGETKTIVASIPTEGVPGYVYKWFVDGVEDISKRYPTSGKTNDIVYTFSYTFNELEGNHEYKLEITDSCSSVAGGNKDISVCTINIKAVTIDICTWITNNGGVNGMTVPKIFILVDAYLGIQNIGFVPTITQILGVVDYYLGFISSGNAKTGCNF